MKRKIIIEELESLNNKINNTICFNVIDKIEDCNLMNVYLEQQSVKKNINILQTILDKYVDKSISKKILKEYVPNLVPAGTKGVVRGNIFNKYIKEHLEEIEEISHLELKFEKKHEKFQTEEIPDWYLYDKKSNKIIIGFNQLDLWSGGQQINRGSKYILDENKHTKNQKTLCVVCNDIELKSTKNKAFKLFETGFKNDRLCYTNGLKEIIIKYFDLQD
jgi:hypothetical protein